MPTYRVTVYGRSREVYIVNADSPEEAREAWSDVEPTESEVDDCYVDDVTEA